MTETLAARVTRIIVGDAHVPLDKAENLSPIAVMAQSIREIEQANSLESATRVMNIS